MKRFNELGIEELASATPETLQTLFELELAHEGIVPQTPPMLTPEPKVSIEPTELVYEVYGNLFAKIEDAEAFNKMKRYSDTYDYNIAGSSDYRYLDPVSDYCGIKPKKFYHKEAIKSIGVELQNIKSIRDNNKKLTNKWESYVKETSKIKEKIQTAYYLACDAVRERKQAQEVFKKHMLLADGDQIVAERFFREAYKGSPDIIAYLFPGEIKNA